MKNNQLGICRICGIHDVLTFEHIPPRRAFNNSPITVLSGQEAIDYPDNKIKGRIIQKGYGAYSLCNKCNNNTGQWYANQFIKWCHQGLDILRRTNGKPKLVYLHYLFPLQIIKQIITMFFTVNNEQFSFYNQELVEFVLSKEKRFLPDKYKVYCYYNYEGGSRSCGVSVKGKTPTGNFSVLSEFNFIPYGYILTYNGVPPDNRLFDISYFSTYKYSEFKVLAMDLIPLPTHLVFPGDYRSKEEIIETVRMNEMIERISKDYIGLKSKK